MKNVSAIGFSSNIKTTPAVSASPFLIRILTDETLLYEKPIAKNNFNYRERKIRRNKLTTNLIQGQVRCCQIWGRRRKRGESHEWALKFMLSV